jgi:hypothetical protein
MPRYSGSISRSDSEIEWWDAISAPQYHEGVNWDWEDYFFARNEELMRQQPGFLICAQSLSSLAIVYLGYTPNISVSLV